MVLSVCTHRSVIGSQCLIYSNNVTERSKLRFYFPRFARNRLIRRVRSSRVLKVSASEMPFRGLPPNPDNRERSKLRFSVLLCAFLHFCYPLRLTLLLLTHYAYILISTFNQ